MSFLRGQRLVLAASVPVFLFAAFALLQIILRFYIGLPDTGTLGSGVVDAHRFAVGLPVYENPATGHPAWIYGPGVVFMAGALFKLFGPSLWLVRVGALLATAGTIALGLVIVRQWLPRFWGIVALASFLAIDCRVVAFGGVETDHAAFFWAFVGLTCCYRGGVGGSVAGALLIVLGGLMKQTAFGFAVVPLVVAVSYGRLPSLRMALLALLPSMFSVVALALIRLYAPFLWHYIVGVPALYPFTLRSVAEAFFPFVAGLAPLVFAAGFLARGVSESVPLDPILRARLRWVACAALVGIPLSVLSFVKPGGSNNSLMPAWYLVLTLTWLFVAAEYSRGADFVRNRWGQAGLLLAIAAILFPGPSSWGPTNSLRLHQGADYRAIIAEARTLPGSVIAPGDPSIMLFARGQHDWGMYPQLDALAWPKALPPALLAAHYSADYVIQTPKMAPTEDDELLLVQRGYTRVAGNATFPVWRAPWVKAAVSPDASSPKAGGQ